MAMLPSILFAAVQITPLPADSESDAITLLSEDFESEDALQQWEIESTRQGRVRITQDPRDPSNHGLLMDDAVNDAVFSQNIARTSVPISGYTDIHVAVDVYSFNNHVHTLEGFDGVVIRTGDEVRRFSTTWQVEQSFSIHVDEELVNAAHAGDGLLSIELHQYGNFSVPFNGLFFDNVRISGRPTRNIYVVSPLETLKSEELELIVLLDPVPEKDVPLTLRRSGEVHGTATYPAGQIMATLTFPNFDNNTLDGDRFHELRITDGRFSSLPFKVLIQDDTPAGLAMSLPHSVEEGKTATGSATVTANRVSPIEIALESSDPTVAAVPPTVNLPVHLSTVTFPVVTFEDPRLLDDRVVTITARVGSDTVSREIVVTEINTLKPSLAGPGTLTEGDTGVEFAFQVDGQSDEEMTITFSAEPGEVSIEPASVTLAPGEKEGVVLVSVEDDSLLQGDRPFVLTATNTKTGGTGTFEGVIRDNDIAGFAMDLPEMIEAEKNLNVTISAVNADGSLVTAHQGTAALFLKDPESGEEKKLVGDLDFINGKTVASLELSFTDRGSVLVVRSLDADVETASVPLSIFANLGFAANDIVYDAKRHKLYTVSGSAALPGHVHSLTDIDPNTAEIGEALFIGGDPRNMVITDQGEYLYIGLWSAYAIQRIDLDLFEQTERIVLDATGTWAGRTYTPFSMLTIPGRPLDLVVGQDATTSTYQTTRLYLNGVVQPQDRRSRLVVPAGSPDEFYTIRTDLKRMGIVSNGIELREAQRGLLNGVLIAGQNDLLFSDRGSVADGLEMRTVAQLSFPNDWPGFSTGPQAVAHPDMERSRVYYARQNQIVAYDTGVFQKVAKKTIPGIGNITRIIRWGDVGLAVLTNQAEVVLLEAHDLVPTGPVTDLAVSIAATPNPALLNGEVEYTATIENISDETARGTRLVIDLSEGQRLDGVSAGDFSHSSQNRTVIIDIGDMKPGESHQALVITEPTEITTLLASAGAMTRSLDIDYANNRDTVVLNVGFASEPESVNVVRLPINEVLYEPVSGDLIVSVRGDAHPGLANRVLAINPTSGLITRSITLPSEPGLLALSDDGSTAYALSGNTGYRLNLDSGAVADTITFQSSFGTDVPTSLVVIPGTVDKLVAGFDRRARLYVGGIGKGEFSNNAARVVALPDPTRVFAYNSTSTGFQSYLLEINGEGLTAVTTASLFSGFHQRIKSDGFFVYDSSGRSVRADLMVLDGTFDFSGAFSGSGPGTTTMVFHPDRAGQRVYYGRGKEIASFDTENYLRVRTVNFPGLPANFMSLERWGDDGFAARLQNNELAIIRTSLVSQSASPIDLLVETPDNIVVGTPFVTIRGNAYGSQGIKSVTVNGQEAVTVDQFAPWEALVEDLVEGENTVTITATTFATPPATKTIGLTIFHDPHLDTTGTGLADSWVVKHFGDLHSPLAQPHLDLSGDGKNNLNAFLFGTDPHQRNASTFHASRDYDNNEETAIYLEFVHRDAPDWDFVVQFSEDLADWSDFAGDIILAGDPLPVEGSPHYYRRGYRITPQSGKGVGFFRIHAVQR